MTCLLPLNKKIMRKDEVYLILNSQKSPYISSVNQPLYTPKLYDAILLKQHTNSHDVVIEASRLTPSQIILFFKNDGLPMSIIADIMKVQRSTVYAWLKNGKMQSHNQLRLEKLHNYLIEEKQASLLHLYVFWNRQLSFGTTLSYLLSESDLQSYQIKKALLELWPIAQQYQQLAYNREIGKNPSRLQQCIIQSNDDMGQQEANKDWEGTLADGSEEW